MYIELCSGAGGVCEKAYDSVGNYTIVVSRKVCAR